MSAGLDILAAGLGVSVQDAGRPGHRSIGVPLSGALDPLLLAAANHLAGNGPEAAGLEVLLAAPTLITSWYGMNFEHMPELAGRFAYPILIAGVALACFGLYRLFKRSRWL